VKSLPFCGNVVEVLKDNPSDLAIVFGFHVIGKGFTDFVMVNIQPILAVHLRLARMDMHWLAPFIGVKEKTPTQ
jgi:hypothetical protein